MKTPRRGGGAGTGIQQAIAIILAFLLLGCVSPAALEGRAAPARLACPAPCATLIDEGLVRWEPMVAVDPTDPLHLVASSQEKFPHPSNGRASWAKSHVSFDGGASWATVDLPGGLRGEPTHPLSSYQWMDDSVLAFLPDGTLLWSAIIIRSVRGGYLGPDLAVLRSVDGGLTFEDEVAIVASGQGLRTIGLDDRTTTLLMEEPDKQWMTVTPEGTAILVWSANHNGSPRCEDPGPTAGCTDLVFSTSDDGRAWSQPASIASGRFSGAMPVVRADGGWVVSYRDSSAGEVWIAISTDRGASWTTQRVDISTKFQAITAEGARLWLVYPRSDEDRDDPQDVALRWSDDGGATWSDATILDAPETAGRTIPAIAPAPGGGVVVTYWHALDDAGELRALRVREGAASEPIVLGRTDGPTSEVGDYMGLVALPDGSAYAVWDARAGEGMRVLGARVALAR